jgi:ADP-heptose:LPS heptosyltransferase
MSAPAVAPGRLADGLPTVCVCAPGLGDVLLCTPALELLRRALPNSPIGFVCQDAFRDTLRNNPDVDRTHGMPGPGWGASRRLARELAPFGYRQAIVFYEHRGVEGWLQGAGVPADRIFVSRLRTDRHRSQLHHGFAASLLGRNGEAGEAGPGPLRIFPDDACRREARALLPEPLASGRARYLVAHIGNSTSRRSRRRRTGRSRIAHRAWPFENWRACLPLLVQETGLDLVLTGSAKEGEVVEQLLDGVAPELRARIHNVAGRTPPLRLAALLEPAAAFVGADTGPTHFAAAVGTPTVGLYGPTDPMQTGPLARDPKRVIVLRTGIHCSPCDRAVRKLCRDNLCLREIGARQVVAAVLELVERFRWDRGGSSTGC